MAVPNIWEMERGIKTLKVDCILKKDTIAFFTADKSDGTKTLFIARLPHRNQVSSWNWFCPNEEQAETLGKEFYEIYDKINKDNEIAR